MSRDTDQLDDAEARQAEIYRKWKGTRSSRLGLQYRVIYRVEAREIRVLVVDITAHDYRPR